MVMTVIAFNWSVFTSSDREAGGVASAGEIDDRLNNMQTALWAAAEKPLTGWGIGRFPAVNTYHHQQWSPDVHGSVATASSRTRTSWGILAELGVIGLALWICVLALIAYRLWDAYRTLPDDDLCGKPLAVIAIMAVAILVCTGLTVDLRFFDFPMAAVFLLAGITIGWSDRHKRGQADAGGDVAEPARHDMPERRALWASTSTETRGGIATYVRAMQQTPLWTDWNIRHVATHRDGSAVAKIAEFARGAVLFVVELIRFRPSVVHLHAASDASFVRKADPVLDQPACPRARCPARTRRRFPGLLREFTAADPGDDPRDALPGERRRRARRGVGGPATVIAPTARITVIPNAVRSARRTVQPAPGDPVHVVFLGRIGDDKGTFRLLDAWAELARDLDHVGVSGRSPP